MTNHSSIGLLVVAFAATHAAAQVADGLQCYKVTDTTLKRLKAVVDLDAPSAGLAPGCRLSRAKYYCTPAKTTVQPGTLYDGATPISGIPYNGRPAATDRICYKVACPRPVGTAADETVTDRFGTHQLGRLSTQMVCTPATGGTLPPPANGFRIETPEIDIDPGQNISLCYFFRTPNTETVPVKRWVSEMGPANRGIVMYLTTTPNGVPVDRFPPGTITTVDCDAFKSGAQDRPHWVYDATSSPAELALPADDGAGNPVAIEIPPNSAAFLMMHHMNTTTQVAKSRVIVNAEAVEGPVYTRSATFGTYDSGIAVPPQTSGYVVSRSCAVPAGATFWRLTTLTHKHAVRAAINDGSDVVVETLDWAHPDTTTWPTAPFFGFASGQLRYSCTYDNPHTFTLRTGNSLQSEEQCMAVGYFFPATAGRWCYNGFSLY
jgi:hypothetical protein